GRIEVKIMPHHQLKKPYMLLVVGAALAAVIYSARSLPEGRLDLRFLGLAVLTIVVSSRLTVRIPRITGHISVSDTFLFLTMLVYGGGNGVVFSGVGGHLPAFCLTHKTY